MASHRIDTRKDGTTCTRVFFRHNGKQTSRTFDDHSVALRFEDLIAKVGAAKALEIAELEQRERGTTALTLTEYLTRHIGQLTGVEQKTLDEYNRFVRKDVAPTIGAIPLTMLTDEDIGMWVQSLEDAGAAPKTIANKHGFLSGALAKAVPKLIPFNPAAGRRLPRGDGDDHEMICLTRDQFAHLLPKVTEPWQPLVEFLVASGCRLGEALALKPGDIDRQSCEVRVRRAWKRSSNGYTIGPPKTKRSRRELNVPQRVIDNLDYSGEWLFTNPGRGRRGAGGPVRAVNFRANVWWPAVARAWPDVDERGDPVPDPLRPRIHDLRHTCASWLIQAGVPLPVVSRHLGHESIQVTVDVYGHIDSTSRQVAANAIDALLGQ